MYWTVLSLSALTVSTVMSGPVTAPEVEGPEKEHERTMQ